METWQSKRLFIGVHEEYSQRDDSAYADGVQSLPLLLFGDFLWYNILMQSLPQNPSREKL